MYPPPLAKLAALCNMWLTFTLSFVKAKSCCSDPAGQEVLASRDIVSLTFSSVFSFFILLSPRYPLWILGPENVKRRGSLPFIGKQWLQRRFLRHRRRYVGVIKWWRRFVVLF